MFEEGRNRSSRRRHFAAGSVIAALAAFALLATAPAALAETFTVTTTADGSGACTALECTLREAVEAANAAGEPSTVVVPPGFYGLTEADLSTGSDLQIEGEVTIEGAGASLVTIAHRADAECSCRVLFIDSPFVTISGVTVAEGEPIENPKGEIGADILYQPSQTGGPLRLEGDVITEGEAASAGGGVFVREGELEMLDSTVIENSAEAGGGVFIENDSGEASTLERNTFVGNQADAGGGLYVEIAEVSVVNSTFTGNGGASARGGAIYANDAELTLLNDTLAGDTAESNGSGGAYGTELYDTSPGTLNVVNTIVGPAGEGLVGSECFLDISETSEANIDAGSSCEFEAATGSLNETDPQLEPLAANGGPTETMALKASSPAIDAANGAACPATDQRGVSRPQGAGCDIGAYEYSPPTEPTVPVTTPATGVAGLSTPCRKIKAKATSFKPKVRPGPVVPGVRVRLATGQPSRLSVKATLVWKDGDKSRTTALGKLAVNVNRWRRVRFPIPASLRDKLPLGTRVTVKLRIEATPRGKNSCGASITKRTIHVHVVKVFPRAVQFKRAR